MTSVALGSSTIRELGGDGRDVLCRDHERFGEGREHRDGDLGGDVGKQRGALECDPSLRHGVEHARLPVVHVGGDHGCVDQEWKRRDGAIEHRRRVVGSRQRLGQPEQGRCRLGGFALLLQQACVLEGHGRMRREDLEQADVVLFELVDPEVRQHDHAGHAIAHLHRHAEDRLLDLRGALDLDPDVVAERVRRVVRLAGLRRPAGEALADLRDQLFIGLAVILAQ